LGVFALGALLVRESVYPREHRNYVHFEGLSVQERTCEALCEDIAITDRKVMLQVILDDLPWGIFAPMARKSEDTRSGSILVQRKASVDISVGQAEAQILFRDLPPTVDRVVVVRVIRRQGKDATEIR
jgi:hypothetical protein